MSLRTNQRLAIQKTIENDFKSGVYFHATGTGKSWIALEIILEFNKRNPQKNVFWLCEQKSILIEQFNKETIKIKGYSEIYKKFLVINYSVNKPKKWFQQINSASYWKKPILLIINRSFLVSQKKYEKIKIGFDLLIHDECHSISNKTTKTFYNYIMNKNKDISCLGFSATPNINITPYDKVISEYTIYDAFCDNVIVKPKINWIKYGEKLTDVEILQICKYQINKLHYKKIIVWCGMISLCTKMKELWEKYFKGFTLSIDTSESNSNFDDFIESEKNAILFCACKHREGSDIKNLDGCVFLDKVENRNPKTFVQCIGRVLRKDKNGLKKFGLIIDLKASSCLKICDRMNMYLNCKNNFPWCYSYRNMTIGKKYAILNELNLLKNVKTFEKKNIIYNIDDITNRFVKDIPNETIYLERLEREMKTINEKNLIPYLIRATEILKLTNYIPHVTRGSCGSSLVCYLLGISNVDPIKFNIKFERFLNDYRDNLPDIDLDFPHYLRDEVFLKLELQWPNQVARISNHVYWHEKSALREAIRKIGIHKQIPKSEIYHFIKSLSDKNKKLVKKYQKELENTFRHYSLHCGGIVFFHKGVPDELLLKNGSENKTLSQIIYDKNDISKHKNFKIDILSSRGISQLIDICGRNIDFSDCPYDEKTYDLLQKGDNIGITLAESPLMRKALLKVKPKSITDIAICLAIIRPAAKDARVEDNDIDFNSYFIFDDDAISILAKNLNIPNDLADKFRRCISKNKWTDSLKKQYDDLIENISTNQRIDILSKLANLRKYSFCKSHSYSYAQLVYKIAYQKAHQPNKFWISTIKNIKSSYRKWVHLYQAKLAGVNVSKIINSDNDVSIYANNRRKKFNGLTQEQQLRNYGYWDMKSNALFPNTYFYEKEDGIFYFGGLIASLRILSHGKKGKIVSSICVGKNKYIEVITIGKYYNQKNIGLKGRAYITDKELNTYEAFIAKYY